MQSWVLLNMNGRKLSCGSRHMAGDKVGYRRHLLVECLRQMHDSARVPQVRRELGKCETEEIRQLK